jgi:hypothetical protein
MAQKPTAKDGTPSKNKQGSESFKDIPGSFSLSLDRLICAITADVS